MRISWPKTSGTVVRGRLFLQRDLVAIRKLIRDHSSWGRTKLSEEVCKALEWRQENGRLKDRGCRVALLKLEQLGYLKLPSKKQDRGGRPPLPSRTIEICESGVDEMPDQIRMELVTSPVQSQLWNGLVAKYHYLGLATPVGRLLRYIISGDGQPIAAISFADPAWSITDRDRLLRDFGILENERRSSVLSNNRFLILPHVQVRNLASRILAQATKQVMLDWRSRFNSDPQFIETFVDPRRFEGTCYRAANWTLVGMTKGFAKNGASHKNERAPKLLFMIGTTYNSQAYLRRMSDRGLQRVA